MTKEFSLLSTSEENKLTLSQLSNYYTELRAFILQRKLQTTTPGAITVAPKLKGITNLICKKASRILAGGALQVVSDGQENIPAEAVIFACTHQGIMDNVVWIPECPKHCVLLHHGDVNKLLILAQLNTGLVLVSKKTENRQKRINNKLDMIKILLKGHSLYYCPEGTWNLSPNKLHLPMSYGFLEVAKKADVPVVPMVIEYTYDTSTPKEKITKAHIRFGKPIRVAIEDDLRVKLFEYEEAVATMRWELIEEKGIHKRESVSNIDYINFVKGNLATLELGKASLQSEREAIRGAKSEFYLFHHINDIPFNEKGEFLETEEQIRLNELFLKHLANRIDK